MRHSEAIEAIEDASSEEYLKRIDAVECTDWLDVAFALYEEHSRQVARLASARAIMQKFVDKVDRGMARSTETYAEMKQWMEE